MRTDLQFSESETLYLKLEIIRFIKHNMAGKRHKKRTLYLSHLDLINQTVLLNSKNVVDKLWDGNKIMSDGMKYAFISARFVNEHGTTRPNYRHDRHNLLIQKIKIIKNNLR